MEIPLTQHRKTSLVWLVVMLAVVMGPVVRPPGAMVALDDGVLSYVICTRDGLKTLSVQPTYSEKHQNQTALDNCDFFASQVTTPPASAPHTGIGNLQSASNIIVPETGAFVSSIQHSSHRPRGPPALI